MASAIIDQGLGAYYRLRRSPARTADTAVPGDLFAYDDPQFQRGFVRQADDGLEARLLIDNLRCGACVWLNEQAIRSLPGVLDTRVNFATHQALIRWDPQRIRLSRIVSRMREIGYRAYPCDPSSAEALSGSERRRAMWRLFVAGLSMMQVMMYAFPAYVAEPGELPGNVDQLMRWAGLLLTLPVMLYSAGPFFAGAARDLKVRRPGMDVPIALGLGIAFLASAVATIGGTGDVYFDSITMFVCFLLAGRTAEMFARQRALRAVHRLARMEPEAASVLDGYPDSLAFERVASVTLSVGQLVLVAPGEAIPADGEIREGTSEVDESLLTGESLPQRRSVGDSVIGGSINLSSALIVRVTHVGPESTLSQLVRLVERAAADRPRIAAHADRAARYLIVLVLILALIAGVWWMTVEPERAIWVVISLLIATCPCALSLATPVALTASTGALARRGLIPLSGDVIETLGRVTDVVLDKTGTVTVGSLRLAEVIPLRDLSVSDCLRLAAGIEARSLHPVAAAIRAAAADQGAGSASSEDGIDYPGAGIEARIDGQRYRIGTPRFVEALAGSRAAIEPASRSAVLLADESGALAAFRFSDPLRHDAESMCAGLLHDGYRIHLVSGDIEINVADVAARLGIRRIRACARPHDKVEYVATLQSEGCVVAFVGDGSNDAPVIARADVSIVMGSGTRLAQRRGDAILNSGRLENLRWGLHHARSTLRVIRQNIAWGFAYNIAMLPLAMTGTLTPLGAALGMSASSLLVVLNAVRLSGREEPCTARTAPSPA